MALRRVRRGSGGQLTYNVTPAELVRYGVRPTGRNDGAGHPLVSTPDAGDPLPLEDAIRLYREHTFIGQMEHELVMVVTESARHTIPPHRVPGDYAVLDALARQMTG